MLGEQIRNALIFVFVGLALAHFTMRFAPQIVAIRKDAQASRPEAPARAPPPAPMRALRHEELRLEPDARGHYLADVDINGSRIANMLIDTGATAVALSYEDAEAIGLFPAPADYTIQVSTANGVAHAAHVKLLDVRIGNVVVHDVDAVVGERGAMSSSLLGMTFLSRLSKFEVASGALILHQ